MQSINMEEEKELPIHEENLEPKRKSSTSLMETMNAGFMLHESEDMDRDSISSMSSAEIHQTQDIGNEGPVKYGIYNLEDLMSISTCTGDGKKRFNHELK